MKCQDYSECNSDLATGQSDRTTVLAIRYRVVDLDALLERAQYQSMGRMPLVWLCSITPPLLGCDHRHGPTEPASLCREGEDSAEISVLIKSIISIIHIQIDE